jgi:YHS domain-containing protein
VKKDPVCGTVFDVRGATAISRYRDRYYYFCSLRCRDAFELAPHRFIPMPQARIPRRTHRRGKAA